MSMQKLLIIIMKLTTTVTIGQVWPASYDTYNQFYQNYQNSYQGYGGGCTGIVMTQVPCQQRFDYWNQFPEYQWYDRNSRPQYTGIMPNGFGPYGSNSMIPRNTGIDLMELLRRGILLNGADTLALDNNALAPRLLGANILNDKSRFAANGCSYDANSSKCVDTFNLCKGRCKNFGDGVTHDCRCVPHDLLAILGLAGFRK